MPKNKLTALGITSGIGSMLIGAKKIGFKVVGNIEWRKYYHWKDEEGRNTFLAYFKDAWMTEDYSDPPPEAFNVDLCALHTECGHASNLNSNKSYQSGCSDIPKAFELVAKLKPRFFMSDNLPKSLIGFGMAKYQEMLPDYDLFPEWVSNWGYGNIQKQRKRFFIIGALKKEKFVFVPGEVPHEGTVETCIKDLLRNEGQVMNHDKHALASLCAKGYHLKYRGHRATWKEMRDYVLKEMKCGAPIKYYGEGGQRMLRVGSYKGHWDGAAHVLTGGISGFHALKGLPYTIRERARIQGFPDDFYFYGTKLDKKGQWDHDRNMHMVKQTGKAMPIQFCTYVAEQVKAHIEGKKFKSTGVRLLPPDHHIDQAKLWYCKSGGGYADQRAACEACWLQSRCTVCVITPPALKEALEYEARKDIRRFEQEDEDSAVRAKKSKRVIPERTPKPAREYKEVETEIEKNW